MADVWFSDCEVFAKDLIWVFKSKRSGEVVTLHNDTYGVEEFLNNHPDIWLCGYNFRDYDQYILKGTLLHLNNDQLKVLNDKLIFGGLEEAWEYLGSDSWEVSVPPIIDLFHDIVPRKSLKEIEANMGMSIQETEVSFDLDRKLNDEELAKTIYYCQHDVDATERLYYERIEYLRTKKTLCEEAGLNDADMMKNTNARVVAEALRAETVSPLDYFGTEQYMDIVPDHIIDLEKMPREVRELLPIIDSYSGWHDPIEPILFDFHGIPTVMGIGGIHASTGRIDYHTMKSGARKGTVVPQFVSTPATFESDDEHVILMQDIGSFYPSMMILFDYLSRAVPPEYKHIFKDFYDMRMEAKKRGDKDRANAAKLVLNTVYGCMKNQYNKLYDPFMATCVCITGQLLILDLMNRICERLFDIEIVQLNTDGWVLKLARSEVEELNRVITEWCELTGFTVETDEIAVMVQRDVNNYVIKFANGAIKAKGGVVKNWKGGTFTSNNATIIDKAIVDYILYATPLAETIEKETDLERFQLVLKAGSEYVGCLRKKGDITEDLQGKVHRVYAVPDGYTYYKFKEGGNPARFPDTPDNCLEDFEIKGIDKIDKMWYNVLAQKKLDAFLGSET